MYEVWYDYVKQKYDEKGKLCYMDTDRFVVHIKADDIYRDIAEDIEARFDTSNYELDRQLPKGEKQKVIGLMKEELGRKIMTRFGGLRAKVYIYLTDNGSEDKKAKDRKQCVIKRKFTFESYEHCLKET